MAQSKRRVVLLGFNSMQLISMVGPADLLDSATQLLGGRGGYELLIVTPDGGPIRTSNGMRIAADMALSEVPTQQLDTLIVGAGLHFGAVMDDPAVSAGLQRLSRVSRRTCSVCTGAFLLANTGILDGRRATTHWAFSTELALRFPDVQVHPNRMLIRDESVMTSAGVTAGMDLALALIEEDHGAQLARATARWTVTYLRRPGGQAQFAERLTLPTRLTSPVRRVIDDIIANPAADHRLGELAGRAALSERHLRRIFAEQTQTTPAAFVERIRVEAARDQLESTDATVERVAHSCGFGSSETMRRAFLKVLGVGPSDYRARFTSTDMEFAE